MPKAPGTNAIADELRRALDIASYENHGRDVDPASFYVGVATALGWALGHPVLRPSEHRHIYSGVT